MDRLNITTPPAAYCSPHTIIDVLESSNPPSVTDDSSTTWSKLSSSQSAKVSDTPTEPDEPEPIAEKRPRSKRVFSLPLLSPHRRLIATMLIINVALLGVAISLRWWNNPVALGYLVISNITAAILIRQQRVINLLFTLATSTRTKLPLSVRWMLGKIYHFGGLHSGCAVSATFWLVLFTASITRLRIIDSTPSPSIALLLLTYIIGVLLICIVILALPRLRMHFHNSFEVSHRFLGWTVLALVWFHTVVLINDYKSPETRYAVAFFTSVSPYLLALVTLSVASPWFYLRKVPVQISKPSNHAIIVRFTGVRPAFPGSSSSISLDPLVEWHAFANIPTPGEDGFRLVISRAGDWTSNIIDNPPSHFWMRGIPTAGVANIETLFRKVLYVCTGSGIGPVLPHLLAKQVPCTLFWSTRTPKETYGDGLVNEILQACPDAVIHDTVQLGKPDMVAMSYRMVMSTAAEAVICISNQKLTRKVVYGMESRGVPAFGAIWDS